MRQERLLQRKEQVLDLTTQRFRKKFTPHFLVNPLFCIKGAGFTLFEVALAMAIFALAASGSLSLFISCTRLTDSAGHITSMVERAREELENRVRRTDFENLNDYFLLTNDPVTLSLVCYVEDHPAVNGLKRVRVVVSYREPSGRIIGGDKDLDGVVSPGDDINSDGELISPCEIVTYIARKE